MLEKAKDTIGKKIITLSDGKELDKVRDVVYDPRENKVRALLVDEGGWFSEAKVVLINDVRSIGPDAVMVQDENAIKSASEVPGRVSNIAEEGTYLTKSKVVTEGGSELGTVSDIYFDPSTGNVEEFEVNQGAVQTVRSGKKSFAISDVVTVGEDAMIVKNAVEEYFAAQAEAQGAQGTASAAGEKAKEGFEAVKEKASDAAQAVKEKAGEAMDKAEEFANRPDIREKANQLGSKMEAAKEAAADKFNEAKQSVQSGQAQAAASDKYQETQEVFSEKAANVKNSISGKIDEMKSNVEEGKKTKAVGQYLKTNILARNDEVLGYRGAMVTNEMIARAEAEGMLENLLNNLSKEPVESGGSIV